MQLQFSQDIEVLLEKLAIERLSLKDILAETSERGFSIVIGLLILPFLLPMPPGFTGVLGSACLLLAVQMALGKQSPWLPEAIAKFRFPRWFILQLLRNLKRVTKVLEKIIRPRWQHIAESDYVWRGNGFCIAWLTLLLMLPIPFTNPIPTLGILLLIVASLESDGLLMCVGYGITILITCFFAVITYAIWQVPGVVPDLFS